LFDIEQNIYLPIRLNLALYRFVTFAWNLLADIVRLLFEADKQLFSDKPANLVKL